MRQQTDVFPDTGPAWSISHPSTPQPRPEPNPSPGRPSGGVRDPNRVKRTPHRKYSSPEEMWAWHWVKMRVVLAWSTVTVTCTTAVTAGVVILSEFW